MGITQVSIGDTIHVPKLDLSAIFLGFYAREFLPCGCYLLAMFTVR